MSRYGGFTAGRLRRTELLPFVYRTHVRVDCPLAAKGWFSTGFLSEARKCRWSGIRLLVNLGEGGSLLRPELIWVGETAERTNYGQG